MPVGGNLCPAHAAHMYSPHNWKENYERILSSILKQVVSVKTRRHIDLEEAKLAD